MSGIAIIVEKTLALSANQNSKVTNLQSNDTLAFKLDQMKSMAERQ